MTKHIHIHIHSKAPTRDAGEWDESKHKRAENGQFGSGGGGAKKDTSKAPATGFAEREKEGAEKMPKGTSVQFGSGKPAGEVIRHAGNMVLTTQGEYHVSKLMPATKTGHQPGGAPKTPEGHGTPEHHESRAAYWRAQPRPYGAEAANLQLSTLHHHANAAAFLKKADTAGNAVHKRQMTEQAKFHMAKAKEGEALLAQGKTPAPTKPADDPKAWRSKVVEDPQGAYKAWAQQKGMDPNSRMTLTSFARGVGINPNVQQELEDGLRQGHFKGQASGAPAAAKPTASSSPPASAQKVNWSASNGDWSKAKAEGRKVVQEALSAAKSGGDKTDAMLALKKQAEVEHKKGSYLAAVVVGEVNDYFSRLK